MKRTIVSAICLLFAASGAVLADEVKRYPILIGGELSSIHYEEPGVMEEKGGMAGIFGSYTFYGQRAMLKVEGRISAGSVNYSSSISGKINNIPDMMLEIRGLGGYDFPLSNTSVITPYAGFGYRYLNDDSSSMISSNGAVGYERESNYVYSPIGIELVKWAPDGWVYRGMAEYDWFWHGKQVSHLSDTNPFLGSGFNDIENRQNDGYGIRGAITIEKILGNGTVEFGPFVRYWNIAESERSTVTCFGVPCAIGVEPKNTSTEIGVTAGIRF